MAWGVDIEGDDGCVRVLPRSLVAVNDLASRFILCGPELVEVASGIVPPWPSSRKRAPKRLAEVPGFAGRKMLDQTVIALIEIPQVCLSKFPTCEAWSM